MPVITPHRCAALRNAVRPESGQMLGGAPLLCDRLRFREDVRPSYRRFRPLCSHSLAYAKCIHGRETINRKLIEEALRDDDEPST
ncbi:MAG TPA: hypothetical protein VKS82_03260 [Streptosporangiaceae bacterium]|nr:hypothetical protein [Streptosporangiaceae bacterium]